MERSWDVEIEIESGEDQSFHLENFLARVGLIGNVDEITTITIGGKKRLDRGSIL